MSESEQVLFVAGDVKVVLMPVYGETGDLALASFSGAGILIRESRALMAHAIANTDKLERVKSVGGALRALGARPVAKAERPKRIR